MTVDHKTKVSSKKDALWRRIDELDQKGKAAFAARCAWRSVPLLICDWKDESEKIEWLGLHLKAIQISAFSAILGSAISPKINIDEQLFSQAGFVPPPKSLTARKVLECIFDAAIWMGSAWVATPFKAAKLSLEAYERNFRKEDEFIAIDLVLTAMEEDLRVLQEFGPGKHYFARKIIPQWLDASTWPLNAVDAEWHRIMSSVTLAAPFWESLNRIWYGEPDWTFIEQTLEVDLASRKNSSGSPGLNVSAPSTTDVAKSTAQTKRIIQRRLVSTTCVTTDIEAEKLTQTARNCMLALREFLVSDETRPPLTVAVEAPWGGGKSSLMRHLQDALTNEADAQTKERPFKGVEPIPTVWFNPWKHEAGKTLWAAFALAFERQLAERLIRPWRVCVRWRLAFCRLTFGDWMLLAARLLVWAGVGWMLVWLWQHPDLVRPPQEKDAPKVNVITLLLQGAPWIGFPLLLWHLISTWNKEFGSPLKLDVSRLLMHNNHADQVDDLHRFHEDFRRLMRAYIPKRGNGKPGKVVVFIDDLDRCEAPKAAELLQSLHQMLNVCERSRTDADKDAPGVICVLGMDREKVAAAVAAKHEKLLPLLLESELNGKVSRANAMTFGHEFLEKFIQLTLHLPAMRGRDLDQYLGSITGANHAAKMPTRATVREASDRDSIPPHMPDKVFADLAIETIREHRDQKEAVGRIEKVSEDLGDGTLALQCARYVSAALENNPRKLKQFVNLFRLRLYLAAAMNFLDLPDRDEDKIEEDPLRPVPPGKLSIHHLAKLVALELAAPSVMTEIRDKPAPKLFDALRSAFPTDTQSELNLLISYRDPLQPEAFDLDKAALEVYFHYFKPENQASSAMAS